MAWRRPHHPHRLALHTGKNGETAQELPHRADAAMYRAKAAGQGCLAL